jgi:hypothetical protein
MQFLVTVKNIKVFKTVIFYQIIGYLKGVSNHHLDENAIRLKSDFECSSTYLPIYPRFHPHYD